MRTIMLAAILTLLFAALSGCRHKDHGYYGYDRYYYVSSGGSYWLWSNNFYRIHYNLGRHGHGRYYHGQRYAKDQYRHESPRNDQRHHGYDRDRQEEVRRLGDSQASQDQQARQGLEASSKEWREEDNSGQRQGESQASQSRDASSRKSYVRPSSRQYNDGSRSQRRSPATSVRSGSRGRTSRR